MKDRTVRTLSSIAVAGFIVAVASGIVYAMDFSIFERATVEWVFVLGLAALAIAAFCAILTSIWDRTG